MQTNLLEALRLCTVAPLCRCADAERNNVSLCRCVVATIAVGAPAFSAALPFARAGLCAVAAAFCAFAPPLRRPSCRPQRRCTVASLWRCAVAPAVAPRRRCPAAAAPCAAAALRRHDPASAPAFARAFAPFRHCPIVVPSIVPWCPCYCSVAPLRRCTLVLLCLRLRAAACCGRRLGSGAQLRRHRCDRPAVERGGKFK